LSSPWKVPCLSTLSSESSVTWCLMMSHVTLACFHHVSSMFPLTIFFCLDLPCTVNLFSREYAESILQNHSIFSALELLS
jgi:hypothetical protein